MNDILNQPFDDYLAHYGQKRQEWYTHKFGRWQNQAMYAVGDQRYADDGKALSDEDIAKQAKKDAKRGAKDAVNDYMVQMASRGSRESALGLVARNSTVANVLAGPLGGTLANVYFTDKKIDSYNTRYGNGADKGVLNAVRNYATLGSKKNRISTIDKEFNSEISKSKIKDLNLSKEYVAAYSSKMETLLDSDTKKKIGELNEANKNISLDTSSNKLIASVQDAMNGVGNVAKINAVYNLGLNRVIAAISPTGASSVLEGALADAKGFLAKNKAVSAANIDKTTGLPVKTANSSIEADMAAVNPGYKGLINWIGGGHTNCYDCTLTMEMRQRGYDVTANLNRSGHNYNEIQKYFPKAISKTFSNLIRGHENNERASSNVINTISSRLDTKMTSDTISKIVNYMKGQGAGARGNICFTWTGTGGRSGHSVFYEVLKNGKVIFRDCQTNRIFTPENLLSKASYAEVTRLDNVPFNIDAIKTVIDAL